jgi:hypothetical protein
MYLLEKLLLKRKTAALMHEIGTDYILTILNVFMLHCSRRMDPTFSGNTSSDTIFDVGWIIKNIALTGSVFPIFLGTSRSAVLNRPCLTQRQMKPKS